MSWLVMLALAATAFMLADCAAPNNAIGIPAADETALDVFGPR